MIVIAKYSFKPMKANIFLLIILLFTTKIAFSQATQALSNRIANYDIDVSLNTENKTLRGKEILTWKNTSRDTLNEFHFHLYLNAFKSKHSTFMKEFENEVTKEEAGYIKITGIQLGNGENLTKNIEFIALDDNNKYDETVVRIKSKTGILPDSTIQFEIDFTAKLPKLSFRTGYVQDYFFVAQWFPKIGVYEPQNYQDSSKWTWNCHQFHAHSEFYADFGVYNVKITLPDNYIVGASGLLWDEKQNANQTKTLHFKANDVIDFAWTASPNYLVYTEKWKDTNISFLYQKEHKQQINRHIDALKSAFEYFETNVGEYPYPSITVIDPPIYGLGAGGMEYPMLITVGTVKFLPTGIKMPELTTIHEFGHQYFMGILATNEFEEAWLDEGINSYYETRIMDEIYGYSNSLIDFAGLTIGDGETQRIDYINLANLRISPINNYAWNFPSYSYGTLVYSKAATMLQTLEGLVGKEVMDRVMQTYFEEWKFKHPKTEDFIKITSQIIKKKYGNDFGENMDWFFEQTLYGTAVCDYSVESILNSEVEKGEDIESDGVISKVRIHRLGDMYLPNELLIEFTDGSKIIEKWDGKAATTVFTFKGKKIKSVQIDPENKIKLNINFSNNSKTLKPKTSSFWKYAEKIMYWLQNIMQLFVF